MSKLSLPIRYVMKVYLCGIIVFLLFRIVLFFSNFNMFLNLPNERINLLFRSFLMEFRFDTVIANYILFFPFILLSFSSVFKGIQKATYRFFNYYISLLFIGSFFLCAADIPYFTHFFSRLTTASMAWTDNLGFMFSMVFQEFKYCGMIIPLILICFLFVRQLIKIRKTALLELEQDRGISFKGFTFHFITFLLFGGLMFLGIRGRIEE
ncbi:MAG: hypothetical protein ACEPOW_00325 [Bacteroidales bacterium]